MSEVSPSHSSGSHFDWSLLPTLLATSSSIPTSPVRYAKFESIRYFIDIDILQNCLIDIDIDIDIFQNHHIDIDIDIDIFGIALSISISISIFSNMTISISISISIFFKSVDISTIDMSYRYIEQGYPPCVPLDPVTPLTSLLTPSDTHDVPLDPLGQPWRSMDPLVHPWRPS